MSKRKRIARFGMRPRTVAVFSETTSGGSRYVRAQWRVRGQLKTRSWPDTADGRREARAFGETLAMELARVGDAPAPAVLTLGDLWLQYQDAEFEALRPKTRINYRAHWRAWELYAGRETPAPAVTRETLDGFRKQLRALGIAVSQIRRGVGVVKQVYRFGVERELVPQMRLLDYRIKVGKDERGPDTAEYEPADALRIIAQLDPLRSTQWRAWLFCTIAHYMGKRANAILHLTWADHDPATGTLRWQAQWDKMGRERVQALPAQVVAALAVAARWHAADRYAGPWLFYTARRAWKGDRPMTYGGVNWILRRAEERAGVPHVHMNAAHRFKRGAVGNVTDLTGGDIVKAMQWVGDDDPKMAALYLKRRQARSHDVAALLSSQGSDDADEGNT